RYMSTFLPLSPNTPAYPFSGFVVNLRVCTDEHKDGFDKDLCTVIVISDDCEGGELCLFEAGLCVHLRVGDIFIFPSCYVTPFNTHFRGLRATLVLHSDRAGDKWAKNAWGERVTRHYKRAEESDEEEAGEDL
ncbi:hypothetical protein B0H17DRAFT_962866, partial [Mycena rosella]